MSYVFPLAHAANSYAMTVLMIVLAVCGRSDLAAEVGLVHAATLITFQAFSGDARSLLLRIEGRTSPETLLAARLLLAIPLATVAWFLSAGVSLAAAPLACALIARRAVEGISELSLAESEYRGRRGAAVRFVAAQTLLLIIAAACVLLLDERGATAGLVVWGVGPLALSFGFLRHTRWVRGARSVDRPTVRALPTDRPTVRALSPHVGSTVIMAVSTYVFRALIVALTGKEMAGDLITAYSLGGLLASVFAIAAGPSLTFRESTDVSHPWWWGLMSRRMLLTAIVYFLTGLAVWATPVRDLLAGFSGKAPLFWQAVGASLCGGAVMLVAWRARFRKLQHDGDDAFGPDVLANVIVLFAVPLLYSVLGVQGLCVSYLVTATASAVIYLGALRAGRPPGKVPGWLLTVILAGLAVPIFFQPANGLFRDARELFDPGGRFALTPLPVSIAACFTGVVLWSDFRRARRGLWMLFFATVLLTFATLSSSGDDAAALRVKLTLMLQVLLPLPALVLGEMLGARRGVSRRLAIVCLAVSGLIAPLECVASAADGHWHLHPKVFVFSIYHYLQYVPVALVSMYMFAMFRLFGLRKWRPYVLAAAPGVAVYSVASLSMAAMGVLAVGVAAYWARLRLPPFGREARRWQGDAGRVSRTFGLARQFPHTSSRTLKALHSTLPAPPSERGEQIAAARRRAATTLAAVSAASFVVALVACSLKSEMLTGKVAKDGQVAVNLVGRLPCWRFYSTEVLTRPDTWLSGHTAPPARERFPSAHNLPLDLAYNFGLPGLIPFAALTLLSLRQLVRHRRAIVRRPDLFGLALIVVMLVFIDNLLKVGLRQPYSGIFSCFVWGCLLARMERLPRSGGRAANLAVYVDEKQESDFREIAELEDAVILH